MGKKNTKTEFLEELNLGTGESRLAVRLIKKTSDWKFRDRDYHGVEVRAEIETGGFGQYSVFSMPITHPKVAQYMADAFARLADHMKNMPVDRQLRAHQLTDRRVEVIRDGLRSRDVFNYEVVTGPNSTSTKYLGRDWVTPKGEFVRFEAATAEDGMGSGSDACGIGEPEYFPHEIGKMVRDVHAARLAANPSYTTYWRERQDGEDGYRYVLPGDRPAL